MQSRLAIGLMLLLCACGSNMGGLPGNGGGGNGGSGGSGGSSGGGGGGSGGGTGGNGGADMAIPGGGDASVAYGCNEILSCIMTCGGVTNKQCVGMCRAGATQMGRGLYQQLAGCLRQACFIHADAATDPCTSGTATPQCSQCIANAEKSSGACSSVYVACASN